MHRWTQQPSPNLTTYRLRAGLSKRALAKLAGVSDGVVKVAENGAVPIPSSQAKLAAALSEALGEQLSTLDLWPLVERDEAPA